MVPHWQESAEETEPLLDSVMVQQGVDMSEVGVVIAYDGPDASELPLDEWRERYPFDIQDVHPPKGGVSATRNAALDAATAEYVMFCDCDDMFCDVCGLFIVFNEMDAKPNQQEVAAYHAKDSKPGFDTLVSVFREESRLPDGKVTYINRDNDTTFVHGKVHNRQFLNDNKLRFDPALTVHEDSYFNILTRSVAKPWRAKYCVTPFYLWKWRDASVCRHDPDYILKTYTNMLDSNDALVDEFVRRMMPEMANQFATMMIFDTYYLLNKPEWIEKTHAEYRETVEKRFAQYFAKHKAKWDEMTPQDKAMISSGVRQRSIGEGMLMEAVTIDQWLEKIQEK